MFFNFTVVMICNQGGFCNYKEKLMICDLPLIGTANTVEKLSVQFYDPPISTALRLDICAVNAPL